ncbi:hypothetical protein L804_05982 [Cryptococcus deuterogattii 2001/935-1]|nr:hypothetical protein L804_05982 [Cryptococcus deuterogattii 2001/935-1]
MPSSQQPPPHSLLLPCPALHPGLQQQQPLMPPLLPL